MEYAKAKKRWGLVLVQLVLILFAAVFLIPVFWMVVTSFKTPAQIARYKELIPFPFSLRSYGEGFASGSFLLYIKNTFWIGFLCVAGSLFSCSLVGFAFAKFKARGKNVLLIILLSTMMVPQTVTLIPSYMLYSRLNWLNTYVPLAAPAFFCGKYV